MADTYPTRLMEIIRTEGRNIAWLARETGVTRQWASLVAHGLEHPSDATRERIAAALRRNVVDVFPGDAVHRSADDGQPEVRA